MGLPAAAAEAAQTWYSRGNSVVYVAVDGPARPASLAYSNPPREESSLSDAGLRDRDVERLVMLTGDNPRAAHAVAATAPPLGLRARPAPSAPYAPGSPASTGPQPPLAGRNAVLRPLSLSSRRRRGSSRTRRPTAPGPPPPGAQAPSGARALERTLRTPPTRRVQAARAAPSAAMPMAAPEKPSPSAPGRFGVVAMLSSVVGALHGPPAGRSISWMRSSPAAARSSIHSRIGVPVAVERRPRQPGLGAFDVEAHRGLPPGARRRRRRRRRRSSGAP